MVSLDENEPIYSIGIAAKKLKISVPALRVYEREGLLLPYRTETGRRIYSHQDIERISAIRKMIRDEELEQVLDATAKLSDLARNVVVMRYIEQASYEEIGRRLGKKPQHVRSACAKAMAQLREMLASENE